ncbi:unnamed protein product [Dracunculus medinensis]|uniref:alpha,alpha-trehalose-phosphate synthase (UDP-forming) n=1 Tax=Dracunculus medinensis TaxID=318479 RepID=A0A3P7PZQ4_DRAME|nr:unnamed protein product [Dracunculus medinensis]
MIKSIKLLTYDTDGESELDKIIESSLDIFTKVWKKRDINSEIAFKGLLTILEYSLQLSINNYACFEKFINAIGYNSVQFWKNAVPYVFDSDLTYGTKFRDSLLFNLTLFDVNNGTNRLRTIELFRELYASVPGIRKSLLGVHAKRFGERYHHLQQRMFHRATSISVSNDSVFSETESGSDDNEEKTQAGRSRSSTTRLYRLQTSSRPKLGLSESKDDSYESDEKADSVETFASGGLAHTHFQQRVINVSNAPPVSLKREKSGEWEIKQGSGGLISCVDPVMSKDKENVWLANIGMNIQSNQRKSISEDGTAFAITTNTLGLPLIKQANADVFFHVLADDDGVFSTEKEQMLDSREEMSLLGVLQNYNRGNYKLNPVIVHEDDYNVYYGGISNGLLWPALHNLPEYIVEEYNNIKILKDHWCAYVRVNYQFAINAVRNSRPQDFIWIHDYHLLLTGLIMQGLDPNLEVGFFLHIPFQPPENFFKKYAAIGIPILRGLLRFTKVGFQTHRDRSSFVELCKENLPLLNATYDSSVDIHTIIYEGWSCSLGVFPVSIKNDDFLKFVQLPETVKKADDIRKEMLGEDAPKDACLFFSVERFDYTKGIKEKLTAYQKYFEKYPNRIGKDVLYQVAVTNRRSVNTYRTYQDECLLFAEEINKQYSCHERPAWKPLVFTTDVLTRSDLVACYLAMDVGVVTPRRDGMNLVAKEMLVCNPYAGLILSTGAGSEIQFEMAGFYAEDGEKCYKRINDLYDIEVFDHIKCLLDIIIIDLKNKFDIKFHSMFAISAGFFEDLQ